MGTALPDRIVTNTDLEKTVETSDEWITTRTGIRQRRLSDPDSPNAASELGARAALAALSKAGISSGEVDAVLCATFTPDCFFPSTACKIQDRIGARSAFAFDLSAACAGFVYGLTLGRSLILSGQASTVVVVGTEIISRSIDWSDRTTCILFGDAAGAVVLQGDPQESDSGILATELESDGSLGSILCLPAWGDQRTMKMNGSEVFRHAVRLMSESTRRILSKAGVGIDQVDLLIPHQANIRILRAIAENVGIPWNKIVTNLESYGNTSSASIPLALEEAWNDGKVVPGTTAVLTSLGGGIAVGTALVRF